LKQAGAACGDMKCEESEVANKKKIVKVKLISFEFRIASFFIEDHFE